MSSPGDARSPLAHISQSWTLTRAEVACQGDDRLWGQRQRENQTSSANCATFTSARSLSGFPPVPLLTDVLRIRFCHLKTHQGDTPQMFYRLRQGAAPVVFGKREWGHFQFLPTIRDCGFSGHWEMLRTVEYRKSIVLFYYIIEKNTI